MRDTPINAVRIRIMIPLWMWRLGPVFAPANVAFAYAAGQTVCPADLAPLGTELNGQESTIIVTAPGERQG